MIRGVAARRLERKRRQVVRARDGKDMHHFFQCIADARFILRKVFRIIEEQARAVGLDPLVHQALIQIYGSAASALQVKELAERLDVRPAFASVLIKALQERGLVSRVRGAEDRRINQVTVTKAGRQLLHQMDRQVKVHVDYFIAQLNPEQKERAVAIMLFYVGMSVR
jgi:DNA-binding MarR family transcriptional regulator